MCYSVLIIYILHNGNCRKIETIAASLTNNWFCVTVSGKIANWCSLALDLEDAIIFTSGSEVLIGVPASGSTWFGGLYVTLIIIHTLSYIVADRGDVVGIMLGNLKYAIIFAQRADMPRLVPGRVSRQYAAKYRVTIGR